MPRGASPPPAFASVRGRQPLVEQARLRPRRATCSAPYRPLTPPHASAPRSAASGLVLPTPICCPGKAAPARPPSALAFCFYLVADQRWSQPLHVEDLSCRHFQLEGRRYVDPCPGHREQHRVRWAGRPRPVPRALEQPARLLPATARHCPRQRLRGLHCARRPRPGSVGRRQDSWVAPPPCWDALSLR